MGQNMNKIHEEAAKRGAEDEKQANDALNVLKGLADDKLKLFMSEVLTSSSHYIEIDKIVASTNVIRAGVSEDDEHFEETVQTLLKDAAHGDFLGALTVCAKMTLQSLFGSYSGNVSEQRIYKVTVGPLGGIYRLDFYLYTYQFTSDTLLKLTKNIFAMCLVVSSVKMEGFSKNTLRDVVQQNFGQLGPERCLSLYKQILAEVEDEMSSRARSAKMSRIDF